MAQITLATLHTMTHHKNRRGNRVRPQTLREARFANRVAGEIVDYMEAQKKQFLREHWRRIEILSEIAKLRGDTNEFSRLRNKLIQTRRWFSSKTYRDRDRFIRAEMMTARRVKNTTSGSTALNSLFNDGEPYLLPPPDPILEDLLYRNGILIRLKNADKRHYRYLTTVAKDLRQRCAVQR